MHGVALGGGFPADVVGRQGDRVALPLCSQGLAVGGELAANPVGVGSQEGRAQPVAEIAEAVIVHIEHLLGIGEGGRHEHIHVALAGEVGGDLQDLHAAAGQDCDAGELRLGRAHGGAAKDDDLLAADLGGGLGMADDGYQNRQRKGEKCKYMNE